MKCCRRYPLAIVLPGDTRKVQEHAELWFVRHAQYPEVCCDRTNQELGLQRNRVCCVRPCAIIWARPPVGLRSIVAVHLVQQSGLRISQVDLTVAAQACNQGL